MLCRDFLTGFHKRKLQRKKKAKEDLEQQLKDERKRLKSEAKESYKKLVVSHRPIPEIENFLVQEQENDDVKVKIEEISFNKIAEENNWIGANRPSTYDEQDDDDSACEEEKDEELPGMELRQTSNKVAGHSKSSSVPVTSKKDVKRILKKQATKKMQKSKVFQQKTAIERSKQKKSALKQKMMQEKKQHGKARHRK